MYQAFIIAFREILEVAIILGVVIASTVGLKNRKFWIISGIVAGIIGSLLVASFTRTISDLAEGLGQELFNAMILFTASFIIIWTAVWMSTHAKELKNAIRNKSKEIIEGKLPKITITVVIALAVLREGSEIVLFSYGLMLSGVAFAEILTGATAGLICGSILGLLLYYGIISIPTKYIFKVTTTLLLLLAAGMASVGAQLLTAAGYFNSLAGTLFNFSGFIPDSSFVGKILHAMFGYSQQLSYIQVIFYLSAIILFFIILSAIKYTKKVNLL